MFLFLSVLLITQYQSMNDQMRPLIIAHRGYSSIIPENSMEALIAAAYTGVDYVEFDIQITRDNQLVVIHDSSLDRVTNINDLPQFAERKTKLDGKTAFYVKTFTYDELQQLTLKQNEVKDRIKIIDGYFKIPLLKDVILKMIQFNKQQQGNRNPYQQQCGVFIECKNPEFYRQHFNQEQGQMIIDLLNQLGLYENKIENNLPVFLHSFDYESIKLWKKITKFPISFLSNLNSLPDTLENIFKQTNTMGVLLQALWDEKEDRPTKQFEKLNNQGFNLMAWTFRDDQLSISKNSIQQYKIATNCLKLDGIITEFSSAAVNLIQEFNNNQQQCHVNM